MQTINRYLFYGASALFIYMPFHIFIAFWFSTYTGGLDGWKIGKDVFAAALTLACVGAVFTARKQTKTYVWLVALTALYGLHHLGILLLTDQPLDTGLLATAYNVRLFCFAVIGYSVALLLPKQFNTRYLLRILLIISSIVCLVGIVQYVLPKDVMTNFGYSIERGMKPAFFIDDKPDLPRIMSTLRDPNSLGAFLILPITVITLRLVKLWRTDQRLIWGGLLLLHGWALLLTFSRSAWLGTVLSVGAALGIAYSTKLSSFARKYAVWLGVILAVLTFGMFGLRDQYFVQNVIFHADESTQLADPQELRVSLVQRGIDGIIAYPLGNGPGTAGLVSVHNENGGLLPENYYVQIGYEVGVLGLMLFLALLCLIISGIRRQRWAWENQALIGSFVGLALVNMLLMTWANEAVACAWFMLAGASMAIRKTK